MQTFLDIVQDPWSNLHELDDMALLQQAAPAIDLLREDARTAGGSEDHIREWISAEVEPVLRVMGRRGQELWDYLCDPNSVLNLNRVGALTILFSLILGLDSLTPANVVSLVCLAIRLKSREKGSRRKGDY